MLHTQGPSYALLCSTLFKADDEKHRPLSYPPRRPQVQVHFRPGRRRLGCGCEVTGSVSWGCPSKDHRLGGFKQQKPIPAQAWRPKVWVWAGLRSPRGAEGGVCSGPPPRAAPWEARPHSALPLLRRPQRTGSGPPSRPQLNLTMSTNPTDDTKTPQMRRLPRYRAQDLGVGGGSQAILRSSLRYVWK